MTALDKKFKGILSRNIEQYYEILMSIGKEIYLSYKINTRLAAQGFLSTLRLPRSEYLNVLKKEGLNYGSIGGLIVEWYLYCLVKSAIEAEDLGDTVNVYNQFRLSAPWKKKVDGPSFQAKHGETKIDIAVQSVKPKRLIYCLEVKTNFEDGYDKYYNEWWPIHHHRTKIYSNFRYHYFSLSNKPPGIDKVSKYRRRIKRQFDLGEIWIFPDDTLENPKGIYPEELIERAEKFLGVLYEPLLSLKKRKNED